MIIGIKRFQLYILVICFIATGGCASFNRSKTDQDSEKKSLSLWGFPDGKNVEKTVSGSSAKDSSKNNDKSKTQFEEEDLKSGKKEKEEKLVKKSYSGDNRSIKPFTPSSSEKSGDIMLNFDEADLLEVIRTFADILEINYTVEAAVSGTVSIHTSRGLDKKDVFPVFYQILESNGLAAVKDGGFYRIIEAKNVSQMPLNFRSTKDGKSIPPEERLSVQIIPLRHISASEMSKMLEPFITENGQLISNEGSNMLLLIEKNSVIQKVNYLVDTFDTDNLKSAAHRFYKLKYSTPDEMSKLLTDVIAAFNRGNKNETIKFVPVTRQSTLIAVSSDPESLKWLDSMVAEFDAPGEDGESRIFVYFIRNGNAEDLGNILNSVFGGAAQPTQDPNGIQASMVGGQIQTQNLSSSTTSTSGSSSNAGGALKSIAPAASINPMTGASKLNKASSGSSGGGTGEGLSTTLKGPIKITTDINRNALIIEAMPSDYRIVSGILKMLDILPRQVLIEVTIADIGLDESDSLGVEWTYKAGNGSPGTSLLEATAGASGMKFVIGEANRWNATLSALASKNKAKILSAPTVLASDNKEARIDISEDIPVVSTEYSATTTGSTPVFQTNVQYRKTGIILSVTPHINENGVVSMKVNQEVSSQGNGAIAGGKEYASFKKRSVVTDLTVANNQTIVIGGLMREERNNSNAGTPVLSNLPLIGFLFGKQSDSLTKTELVILITPRVINSSESVDKMTENFRKKIETVFIEDHKKLNR
ncbi:type II secretion system secretin GspD [Desulforegula conservatrix]|uniref:type II secretion system secretin GspD n=1 Tax=Desulforegula conservatrix TaxID=153026 RepID=UPI0004110812|nr:type II secretion system secretin GspD [Desulforegula conservatrix]